MTQKKTLRRWCVSSLVRCSYLYLRRCSRLCNGGAAGVSPPRPFLDSTTMYINSAELKRFTQDATKDLLGRLGQTVSRNASCVEVAIKNELHKRIVSSPEMMELCGRGELWSNLGVTDPTNKVDQIARAVAESLTFKWVATNKEIKVTITAQPSDYHNLLSEPYAYEYEHVNSTNWAWLETLLFGVNLSGFRVLKSPPLKQETLDKYSRTGAAIMIRANGSTFSLEASPDDNFITRSLTNMEPFLWQQLKTLLR